MIGRVFLLLALLSCAWQPLCHSDILEHSWSQFDRTLSVFNPAGRYVREPLEKAIPALTVKGFFRQWSDINLHRD
ncbi:MAG: hypothetical protein ACREQ3_21375, partial [Candidatus Binatia bacterium]